MVKDPGLFLLACALAGLMLGFALMLTQPVMAAVAMFGALCFGMSALENSRGR